MASDSAQEPGVASRHSDDHVWRTPRPPVMAHAAATAHWAL